MVFVAAGRKAVLLHLIATLVITKVSANRYLQDQTLCCSSYTDGYTTCNSGCSEKNCGKGGCKRHQWILTPVERDGCCSQDESDCSGIDPTTDAACQYLQSDCEGCGGSWLPLGPPATPSPTSPAPTSPPTLPAPTSSPTLPAPTQSPTTENPTTSEPQVVCCASSSDGYQTCSSSSQCNRSESKCISNRCGNGLWTLVPMRKTGCCVFDGSDTCDGVDYDALPECHYLQSDCESSACGGSWISTTPAPTFSPTTPPTQEPSPFPSSSPTKEPTPLPSNGPTDAPTKSPTASPSNNPTEFTTGNPTLNPTSPPTTSAPTDPPTSNPTKTPSTNPTIMPTSPPTFKPTDSPAKTPTTMPTSSPTFKPTDSPAKNPTTMPTSSPTLKPTDSPAKNPTTMPTSSPTEIPTSSPTKTPTKAPSNLPTSSPTMNPTADPSTSPTDPPTSMPTNNPTGAVVGVTCPPVGTSNGLTPGIVSINPSGSNELCGIYIHKSSSLVPFARSYDGAMWEAAPGPMAPLQDSITCSGGSCEINLPDSLGPDENYVVTAIQGNTDQKKEIARFLEMTTFGVTKDELTALDTAGWGEDSRAEYVRNQIDLPATSHREYFRKRANPKWDASAQPGRSDHPCSPNSKWRKYSYIRQDRQHTIDSGYIETYFETVPEEANLTTTIYEADSASDVTCNSCNFVSSQAHFSGDGFYDMGGNGDWIEWSITVPEDGTYPVSFRYAIGSSSYNGYRPLDLWVNGVEVLQEMNFIFTDSWSFWKYSDLIDINLLAGQSNTIRLLVTNGNGGPNIDHMRIGKPPAVVLKTNGWPRTVAINGVGLLDNWGYQLDETYPYTFRNSYPQAPQGDLYRFLYGTTRILLPTAQDKYLDIGNPPITFTGYEQYLPLNYFTFTDETFVDAATHLDSYPVHTGEELLLVDGMSNEVCDRIPLNAEEGDAPVFGLLPNGEWLIWTPSLILEDNGPGINTPEGSMASSTLNDGGGSIQVDTAEKVKCANVQRSFVNEKTCKLSTSSTSCTAAQSAGEVPVEMNTTNVIKFYEITGSYVYAIQGLVMENVDEHPCSKTKSRWTIAPGQSCPNPTLLASSTNVSLVDAISSSPDTNPFIVDATRMLSCDLADHDDANDELEIQIQVGSNCYTHVHPDHLNVYDFSGWVTKHPGGEFHIRKWAEGWEGHPGWYLDYPFAGNETRGIPEHPMSRWYNRAAPPDVVYVTRLGDSIAYRDLPNDLKTSAVAEYFGATPEAVTTGGVVVCGSIGEVSNDPSLFEVFDIRSDEITPSSSSLFNNQKHVVWTEVNLFGSDQLRQRVAWALAQMLTVVPSNTDTFDRTEVFLSYYDILVRHAFGNFRDILAEISYNPLMAEHLSFLKSKSHAYVYRTENKRISSADENFAREIMQLFSVGLIGLNQDGTPQIDANGELVQVYTNEDIESFARAWTGFDRTASRGNVEDTRRGTSDNRLDPMTIVVDYRDAFPKSDLVGGFIGDGYQLCEDLPDQFFLKKGAHYRLLGGKSSPELMKDTSNFAKDATYPILRAELSETSALYQILYNGGNYQMSVQLENDLLCDGIECVVDTLRVVKVGSIYYEFVPPPCVQLAFYNNGKQIQLRDNYRRGQMCANPKLPHAREACCRQDRYLEVRSASLDAGVTHFYDGERMSYDTAEQRCGNLCVYEGVTIRPNNDYWRKGYHWTSKDCGINVKVNPEGYVAIVHDVDSSNADTVPWHVEEKNTLNWFRVFWDGNGEYPGSSDTNNCAANNCVAMEDDSCLCKTSVTENIVFTDIAGVSKDDIVSQLSIGSAGPTPSSIPNQGEGFVAHVVNNVYNDMTVFEVEEKGKTVFFKNVRSTVNIQGWDKKTPEIFEAEAATSFNCTTKTSSSATGGSYVDYGFDQSYLEWNVDIDEPGSYLLSFRYALDSAPRSLAVFVNGVETQRSPANPTIQFNYISGSPVDFYPLDRCEGDCDNDEHCSDGLFCVQNSGLEKVPGCTGTQSSGGDYCADVNDFPQGAVFYPTGGWDSDWLYTEPLEVTLVAGSNVIRAQIPTGYDSGPNIDHIKIEGITASSPSPSFRNPPHFVSLIPDYSPNGLGEKNIRDAQYETDAVLDHYFYHDNVAPFLCTRIIQRFGVSNPSPRYVSECSKAFRTGSYVSGSQTFGDSNYGNLEAMIAAIILDPEVTSASITNDPGHGSLREPIIKVIALMRSMEYGIKIPDFLDGPPMRDHFQVKLWAIDEDIGQGPYEFPTVFSFFLPEYIPDSGPALSASYLSPESMLLTMPNSLALLNGLFSLIKYGLSDCNGGFTVYPGYSSCRDNGLYERSFGRLFYEPEGTTTSDIVSDIALLLTSGRLSSENHAVIEQACSLEPDRASIIRCIQQLIVTTGEFHSTNTLKHSGEGRNVTTSTGTSTEPYKAIIYFYLGGGCDSYNMLAPFTCTRGVDVYEKYRSIRGKSDISEGVGLPKSDLLEIQANNIDQPCETFGLHRRLEVLETLYNDGQALFVANAGLLAKEVNTSNYRGETPVQLFAHNAMTLEAQREDLADEYSGTGVGGRMADVLTQAGIPTNTFSINGQRVLLSGEAGQGPSQFILSSNGLSDFNKSPSISNMNEVIQKLNNATTEDSGFFAETWSSKLSDSMLKQDILTAALGSTTTTANFPNSGIGNQLKMVTRLMQTANVRGSKRDVFYVSDGGYDTHSNVLPSLDNRFITINDALEAFVNETKTLNFWDDLALVQFTEFARTLDPNSNDGSDHAWGGNHFLIGGSVNGGKILGKYPNDFVQSASNPIALSRGRMIPTYPWDAMWYGTAQWFGINAGEEMDKVLPMHSNFDQSKLYDVSDLFV